MQIRSRFTRRKVRAGFTLVELLVVISIIGVLAGLALPMYQKSMVGVRKAKGISNLRQAGAACMAYAAEHESMLPGPCPLGVIPYYSKNNAQNLGAYLAPYLGLPDPATVTNSSKPQFVPILISPGMVAWNSSMASSTNTVPHYIQSDVLKGTNADGSSGTIRPFGALGSNGGANTLGIRLARLSDFNNATTNLPMSAVQAWLLSDVDQMTTDNPARQSGWFSSLPTKPVYGTKRVRVYGDGHAEAADLTAP